MRENIRNIVPYSTARDDCKARMEVYLDANENPYPNGVNRYPSPHQPKLKSMLSVIKKIPAGNIFVGNGSDEPIDLIFRMFCPPGKSSMVQIVPTYGMYSVAAAINDVRVIDAPLDDGFTLDADTVLSKVENDTRVIFLCSPNNPTGHVYSREELGELLELCRRHDIFLIVDEVYREFCYDGETFTSVLSFPEYGERIICIDSFSKRFSMCGARVGAIVSHNRDVLDSAMKLAQARLCPPAIEQVAAAAALNAPDEYIQNVRQEYERRRNLLVSGIQEIPGCKVSRPKGAFYFVVDFPVDDAEKFSIFMLREFSWQGNTVMFAPAEDFYVTKHLGKTQARIAYVLNEDELRLAVKCLEEGLKAYRKKCNIQ